MNMKVGVVDERKRTSVGRMETGMAFRIWLEQYISEHWDNAKELLELIPSKITDTMGIIADVNLLYKDGLEYLEIIVDKYPSLISFRGKYYYRSGSTMREITGKELERTLLKTQGRTWDGVPLPKLSVTDLKQDAIQLFKEKSVRRGRLTQEDVKAVMDLQSMKRIFKKLCCIL